MLKFLPPLSASMKFSLLMAPRTSLERFPSLCQLRLKVSDWTPFWLFFCGTSSRRVGSTTKLCTDHSLSNALSLNLSNIKKFQKILEKLRIKPGPAGCEARMLPLCYAPPPSVLKNVWVGNWAQDPYVKRSQIHDTNILEWDSKTFKCIPLSW